MVTIKTDLPIEEEREIAKKLIPCTDIEGWYSFEYIKGILELKPFYLIENSWKFYTIPLLEKLIEISKSYPNAFFTIDCDSNTLEGYIRYIHNGKTQLCLPELVYKGCNPKEMKTLEEENNW